MVKQGTTRSATQNLPAGFHVAGTLGKLIVNSEGDTCLACTRPAIKFISNDANYYTYFGFQKVRDDPVELRVICSICMESITGNLKYNMRCHIRDHHNYLMPFKHLDEGTIQRTGQHWRDALLYKKSKLPFGYRPSGTTSSTANDGKDTPKVNPPPLPAAVRYSRSDAMSHYPFADGEGNMIDVLHIPRPPDTTDAEAPPHNHHVDRRAESSNTKKIDEHMFIDDASDFGTLDHSYDHYDPPIKQPQAHVHNQQRQGSDIAELPNSRIYHMGAPGRNRLAAKIYDELCIGKKGMKVSDILDGLKLLEISPIPPLLVTRCKQLMKKSVAVDRNKSISVPQWQRIVNQCIKFGLSPKPSRPETYGADDSVLSDVTSLNNSIMEDCKAECAPDHNDVPDGYSDVNYDGYSMVDNELTSEAYSMDDVPENISRFNNASRKPMVHQNYTSQLRKHINKTLRSGEADGPKKFGKSHSSTIQHHRKQYLTEQSSRQDTALASLAKARADDYCSRLIGDSRGTQRLRPPIPQSHTMRVATTKSASNPSHSSKRPSRTAHVKELDSYLESGSAINELTDMFLNSKVAGDVLRNDRDYHIFRERQGKQPIPVVANDGVDMKTRHLHSSNLTTHTNTSGGHVYQTANAQVSSKDSASNDEAAYAHRSMAEKVMLQEDEVDLKRLLYNTSKQPGGRRTGGVNAPGQNQGVHGTSSLGEGATEAKADSSSNTLWRSTKGGWVADFGPPHTHVLYTGTEMHQEGVGGLPLQPGSSSNMHTKGEYPGLQLEEPEQSRVRPWKMKATHPDSTIAQLKHVPGASTHAIRNSRRQYEIQQQRKLEQQEIDQDQWVDDYVPLDEDYAEDVSNCNSRGGGMAPVSVDDPESDNSDFSGDTLDESRYTFNGRPMSYVQHDGPDDDSVGDVSGVEVVGTKASGAVFEDVDGSVDDVGMTSAVSPLGKSSMSIRDHTNYMATKDTSESSVDSDDASDVMMNDSTPAQEQRDANNALNNRLKLESLLNISDDSCSVGNDM